MSERICACPLCRPTARGIAELDQPPAAALRDLHEARTDCAQLLEQGHDLPRAAMRVAHRVYQEVTTYPDTLVSAALVLGTAVAELARTVAIVERASDLPHYDDQR